MTCGRFSGVLSRRDFVVGKRKRVFVSFLYPFSPGDRLANDVSLCIVYHGAEEGDWRQRLSRDRKKKKKKGEN